MKTCPTCGDTFEDSINYCLQDGTPLASSFPLGNLTPPRLTSPVRRSQKSIFAKAAILTALFFLVVGGIGLGAVLLIRNLIRSNYSQTGNGGATSPTPRLIKENKAVVEPAAPEFARETFRFGSEGIGAGQFQSIAAVAIDTNGKIYVSEGRPGRVQIFEADGKFLTQWTPPDKDSSLEKIVFDRSNTAFAVQGASLIRLDRETGKQTGQFIKSRGGIFYHDDPLEFMADDVVVTLDGNLRVLVGGGTILKMNADGKTQGKIVNAPKIASYSGKFKSIALDGLGNIYALSDHDCYIFKFSDEGKFINRFGSKRASGSPSDVQPGQCSTSFSSLAVDGKGRIFVSDSWSGVSVFDGDGKVIGSFKPKESLSNMFFNDKNELWATSGKSVVRYEVNQ